MHLADAFIQSDLHCIQVTVLHLTSSCFPLLICLRLISSGRVIVCVRYGTNYVQKQRLGGKKNSMIL